MARATKSKKKSSVISVDFTGVEGGKGSKVPAGEYDVEVAKVTEEEGGDSGQPYLSWQFKITEEGAQEGKVLYYNTSLQQQALWNLKNVLEALGVEGTDSAMDLDLDEMVGYTCRISVEIGEYNNKPRSEVVDIFPIEEKKSASRTAKNDVKKGGSKSKKEVKYDADTINEMDADELAEVVEKAEIEVDLDDYPTLKRKRAAVIDALDDADKLDK